ncbi:MAG: hypothetical protein SRB1_01230 [Desulfobacteraceae bacterium Eth-SRB1]|nr:MAG: hypothetical protein SRB1_01230 [Desulfobacteraceae bacterium Eth-SRB1]
MPPAVLTSQKLSVVWTGLLWRPVQSASIDRRTAALPRGCLAGWRGCSRAESWPGSTRDRFGRTASCIASNDGLPNPSGPADKEPVKGCGGFGDRQASNSDFDDRCRRPGHIHRHRSMYLRYPCSLQRRPCRIQ